MSEIRRLSLAKTETLDPSQQGFHGIKNEFKGNYS